MSVGSKYTFIHLTNVVLSTCLINHGIQNNFLDVNATQDHFQYVSSLAYKHCVCKVQLEWTSRPAVRKKWQSYNTWCERVCVCVRACVMEGEVPAKFSFPFFLSVFALRAWGALQSSFSLSALSQVNCGPRMISVIICTQDKHGSEKMNIGGKKAADAIWSPRNWLYHWLETLGCHSL